MSVLIVEGGPGIRRLLRDQLHDQGVEVTVAVSIADALAVLKRQSFDVVILDLALPDGSGCEVLDALGASGASSHIIVMSESTAEADRIAALARGADDFVVKPFFLRELTRRVLAVRRRGDPERDALLRVGTFTIDLRAREVRSPQGLVELTAKEFDLFAFLAARPGYVFGRDQLLHAVWHSAPEWQRDATVTEHIRRLRAKVEIDPRRPRILRTVRGSGYRLDLPAGGVIAVELGGELSAGTVIHVDGRIVQADRAAAALMGVTDKAELIGRQIFELASPGSMDATRQRMADTIDASSRERRTELIDLERADGTRVTVELATETVDWEGQRAGQVSFTQMPDLSARLRRLVTGVLSELTDAVIITDLHFHLRSWNEAAARLYGWRAQEVLGRHVLDVLQWVGDGGVLAVAWESIEVTGRWKGEVRQLTRDGSVISVLECTTLVRDDAGEPVVIVSVNRPTPVIATEHEPAAAYDHDQIRRGIANDEFEVYYQPVVALGDASVLCMEALVRWNHPQRGLLLPGAFIEAAEHSGSIIELGNVVLDKACRQAAEWRDAGVDIELSVNLSARQLSDPELFNRLTEVLAFTGLAPDKLWLEVTETALVEEVDRASEVLHRLADLGIGVSIDDFGTGWASLTYLRNFPVHALKIDGSFVDGVGSNANDTAIVRSILSLGAELGLSVIAEGIETAAQQEALQRLGCALGQGYLFGRPSPASATSLAEAPRIASAVSLSAYPSPSSNGARVGRVPLRPVGAGLARSSMDVLPLAGRGLANRRFGEAPLH